MKNLKNILPLVRPNQIKNFFIMVLLSTLTMKHQSTFGQSKKVVVSKTLTTPDGNNYHALQNMKLESGFIYDSQTSGAFYVETGDFVNSEPAYGNNRNKVTTEIAKEATTSASTLNSWGKDKKHTVVSYSDGLGRTVQSTYQQGSPLGKDMIQHFEYDQQGRRSKMFLPYVGTTTDGSLHTSAVTEQAAFFNNTSDDIADSNSPFAETDFDDSPLNRVLKTGAPGDDWQLSSGNNPELKFLTNDVNTVRKFTSAGTSTGNWSADELALSEVRDENGHYVEQYSDRFGRLLLKKVEQSDGVWSYTYHIYDELGRLKYTIQPEGYQKMITDNNYNVSHVIDDYVFEYTYDDRGRMVEKKVPGADPVYYIYDSLDRVVLTQNGILRASNKWHLIRYDINNRIVITGFHTDATNNTRALKQANANAFDYGTNNHFEERNNSAHGYTSRTYPTNGTNTEQIVYYYDDYDFDGIGASEDYTYVDQGFGNIVDYDAINRLTGMKQKILDETVWLWDVHFYDKKGRRIQTRSNNELQSNMNDVVTTRYHFDGRIEKTERYVDGASGQTVDVDNRYVYDDSGRLTEIHQDIDNSGTEQQVAEYKYNELGQLAEKQLHGDGTDFLQSVDYRYNIRGWMTKINGSDLANNQINTGDDYDDIFGMDLLYNTTESGIGNMSFYNGNISAVKWQTDDPNSNGTKRERSYAFTYDRSDRLTGATFKANNGSNWTTEEQGAYDVSGVSYDRNGNIQGLQRYYQQDESSSRSKIDDLIYTYNANKLIKVEDSGNDGMGYTEGTDQTTEYTYDANGNILTDENKGLTYTYNELNKTSKVQFSLNKYIEYTYNSSGGRIKKKVYDNTVSPVVNETWRYIKGFVFKDNVIDHFAMNEGVVRNVNGDYRYEYMLSDHQGNTRMSFAAEVPDQYVATMEDSNATIEEALFNNVSSTRTSYGSANHTSGGSKVARLNPSNPIGPALSLKVAPGDKLDIETWAYHEGGTGYSNSAGMNGFIATLASAFGGASGGAGEIGDIFDGVNEMFAGMSSLNGTADDGIPAAYLNYILLDDNYDYLSSGFVQVSGAANWSQEQLSLNNITVTNAGYAFIYVSLESDVTIPVHFDDLKVTHTRKIAVLQENHYYPFGLSMEGVATHVPTPSSGTANKYLYNQGSEMQELDIRNYDTPFRQYDPALGRFQAVDPLADNYTNQTPYQYGNNDPIYWNDPTGLRGQCGSCLFTEVRDHAGAQHDSGGGGGWANDVTNFIASYNAQTALQQLNWSTHGGSWNSNGSGVSYRASSTEYLLMGRWENYYSASGKEKFITVNGEQVTVMPTFTLESRWVPKRETFIGPSPEEFHGPKNRTLSFEDFDLRKKAGIIPYADTDDTAGMPDIFEDSEDLESVELTETDIGAIDGKVPETKNFIGIILNAIKVRMWSENVGSKAGGLFDEPDTLRGHGWTIVQFSPDSAHRYNSSGAVEIKSKGVWGERKYGND